MQRFVYPISMQYGRTGAGAGLGRVGSERVSVVHIGVGINDVACASPPRTRPSFACALNVYRPTL
jgi:hypothetical protein